MIRFLNSFRNSFSYSFTFETIPAETRPGTEGNLTKLEMKMLTNAHMKTRYDYKTERKDL